LPESGHLLDGICTAARYPIGMRSVSVTVASLCLAACGATDVVTTASDSLDSPDGHWTAIVESKQWSGPGNAFDATHVDLKQKGQPPFRILEFTHEYATMKIRMTWMDAQHLKVQFGPSDKPCDHVDVTFQAVRAADIEIRTEPFRRQSDDASC